MSKTLKSEQVEISWLNLKSLYLSPSLAGLGEGHKKDLSILAGLKDYFGDIGKIDGTGRDRESFSYSISSRKLITAVVLPHFDRYPLMTQKQADYELFKQIILKMNNKEHLTNEGLQEIVNLRASLNLGLSEELKAAFPCTVPVSRPRVSLIDFKKHIAELPWISGFVSGEGCFSVVVSKSSTSKLGFNVRLRFILSQHSTFRPRPKALWLVFSKLVFGG